MDRFPEPKQRLNSIASDIEGKREQIEQENFAHIDLRLSVPERESLNRITIERDLDPFDAYGPVSDDLKAQLALHLESAGQNDPADIERISAVIHRLASGVQSAFGKEAAWITVRVSMPNPEYDVPRWHSDGAYFTTADKTYKLVTALKGAPTLFGKIKDEPAYQKLQDAERENQGKNADDPKALDEEEARIRDELTKVIESTDVPAPEQATVYLVGAENAMIHSEPPIKEPRIFVSVLPGSREQIEEWRKGSA